MASAPSGPTKRPVTICMGGDTMLGRCVCCITLIDALIDMHEMIRL